MMEDKYGGLPSCNYCPPASLAEDGKQKQACCGTACIDVAAQRECDAEDDDASLEEETNKSSSCAGGCCSSKTAAPNRKRLSRSEKLKAARERYAATLEAVGCICRALLARNLETCCSPETKRSLRSVSSTVSPRPSTSSSRHRAATSSGCCSTKEPGTCAKRKKATDTCGNNTSIGDKSGCDGGDGQAGSESCGTETNCCNNESVVQVRAPIPNQKSCCSDLSDECEKTSTKACCSKGSSDNVTAAGSGSPAKGGCCSEKPLDSCDNSTLARSTSPPKATCETKSCCSKKSEASLIKETCATKSCCTKTSDTTPAKAPIAAISSCGKETAQAPAKTGCAKSCCSDNPGTSVAKDADISVSSCGVGVNTCAAASTNPLEKPSCSTKSCCSDKNHPTNVKQSSITKSCGKLQESSAQDSCAKSCCKKGDSGDTIISCKSTETSSVDDCCNDAEPVDKGLSYHAARDLGGQDIEKAGLTTEHITLSIEGMTCVGCENKLFRSLSIMPGIQNLQTSLVMARAEFDLDSKASIDELIKEVAKTTGFTCQRLSTQGQTLDVLVPGDARDFVNQKLPYGVEDMTPVDKTTVRLAYDAKVIGARDLLGKGFDGGLSLAPARPYAELESGSKHVRETAFMTLFSAVLTIPVLVLAWAPLEPRETLYGSISLALATIVQFVVAGPFYPSAFKALLFTRVIEMDLLIVLSTSTAYIFSVVAFAYQVRGHPLSTGEFFETSTLLVTLIMVGRLVSAFARHKAVESISVRSLQSQTALLVDDDTPNGYEIDARLLQYGDVFKVLPDSRIATDGTVISGESEVDESHVTGEAVPVEKSTGSNVIAGCLNGSGTLIVRLRRLPGENTISEIATMVDAAKFSKPKIQELADRVASYFVPVVIMLTLITFAIWIAVGMAIRHQSGGSAVVQAITYAISVLIVSCPCAIGLAVPMVVVIAGGVGARYGVVFKSAETIEIARKVSHVVFDKTGTLTQGQLSVSAEEYLTQPRNMSAAALVLGLTINSKHPVSAAVAAHLMTQDVQPATVDEVRSVTGSGMEGVWGSGKLRGGNSRWLAVQDIPEVSTQLSQGRTVFCVALGEDLLAVYGLDDSLRPDAKSTVTELQSRGIAVSLVSGDDDGAVQRIGRELGIDVPRVRSRCSPGDKQKYIKNTMDGNHNVVLFCGDGTNDAVALAQASIGLHMNSGTDVAQSAADAVLVRPALEGVLVLIDLSRAAFRRIVFNFTWSFIYNTVAVLLAAGAFVNARIPPEYAGLGEIVSVLPVILIALQLRWFKRD